MQLWPPAEHAGLHGRLGARPGQDWPRPEHSTTAASDGPTHGRRPSSHPHCKPRTSLLSATGGLDDDTAVTNFTGVTAEDRSSRLRCCVIAGGCHPARGVLPPREPYRPRFRGSGVMILMRALTVLRWKTYYHSRGVTLAEVKRASWRKSSFSNLNGNCIEIGRFSLDHIGSSDRIGIRDTKDKGRGPALIFSGPEWGAFIAAAKCGEFDDM